MKRSNPLSSKKSPGIGFFSDTRTPLQNADEALARIPIVPHETNIFQHNEKVDPWEQCYSAREAWDKLKNPVRTVPRHHVGLNRLRKLAKRGVATVIPYNQPAMSEHTLRAAHQLLAAGPVIYTNPHSSKKKIPGVVFHPGNSTLTAHIRGDANPHLGFKRLHGHNKLWEWQFVSHIDPTAMSETIAIDELPIYTDAKLVELRQSIRERLNQIVQKKIPALTNKDWEELSCYLKNIFAALRTKFPEGAFIKPVESSCSLEYSNLITTMNTNEETLAEDFLQGICYLLRKISDAKTIESPMLRTILLSESKAIYLIVHDLLFNPREVIGQAALKIAQTENGKSFEIRVDFLQGKALRSTMRFDLCDYYPREQKAAADFLDQFFKKANFPNRMLCGGADIALGQDGNWHIIELNLGAESLGLEPGINWNCYVSSFLGRNTDLIFIFESIFAAPLEEQKKFLSGLKKTVLNHPGVRDMREVLQWFRDRYCQSFLTNPTFLQSYQIKFKLEELFSVVSFVYQRLTTEYVHSATTYMQRELRRKKYFVEKPMFFSKDPVPPDSVTALKKNSMAVGPGIPKKG